jgi:predicted Zn-dependent protease with MMP-like domain
VAKADARISRSGQQHYPAGSSGTQDTVEEPVLRRRFAFREGKCAFQRLRAPNSYEVSHAMHAAGLSSCKCRDRCHKPPIRSRLYPSTDSGTIAQMDARSEPGLNDLFEAAIYDALSSLPTDLRAAISNVEMVVEDEPPDGRPLLGLYRGVPLPRRSSTYSGVLPDKISIFRGPITRLAAGDADRLRREVRHVVLHEIAHHFGISDERLIELDRY